MVLRAIGGRKLKEICYLGDRLPVKIHKGSEGGREKGCLGRCKGVKTRLTQGSKSRRGLEQLGKIK